MTTSGRNHLYKTRKPTLLAIDWPVTYAVASPKRLLSGE